MDPRVKWLEWVPRPEHPYYRCLRCGAMVAEDLTSAVKHTAMHQILDSLVTGNSGRDIDGHKVDTGNAPIRDSGLAAAAPHPPARQAHDTGEV